MPQTPPAVPGGEADMAADRVRPAIVVVSHDAAVRAAVVGELSHRYGGDYTVTTCTPDQAAQTLASLRDDGARVALFMGGYGGADPDGLEVITELCHLAPGSLR